MGFELINLQNTELLVQCGFWGSFLVVVDYDLQNCVDTVQL